MESRSNDMKSALILSQKGAILVVCLLLLVVLSLMGVAAIMTTSTETKISANSRKAEQAFFAADAGIENARMEVDWGAAPGDTYESDPGDPYTYQTTILGRIDEAEVRVFDVESRGWDPLNRSQRVIRADIEISRTRGAIDEGGYAAGY